MGKELWLFFMAMNYGFGYFNLFILLDNDREKSYKEKPTQKAFSFLDIASEYKGIVTGSVLFGAIGMAVAIYHKERT